MFPKTIVSWFTVLVGLAVLVTANPVLAAETASGKPNMLLILSDDQSAPHMSCMGDPNVRTPNMDRLAAGGFMCDRFFMGAPQCVPARASLLSGRSPVAARITRFSSPLPRDIVTFPECLREKAGYFTGVCGRVYHLDGSGNLPPASRQTFEKLKLRTFPDRMDFVEVGNPGQNPQRFEAFLAQKPADKPFFFWINYSDPHHPWTAKDFEPDPAKLTLPPYLPDLPGVRADLAAYYGEVMRVDADLQKVLDVLDKHGLTDNTIVVFAGDNGYAFPHGKGSLYDPGINTPLVVRWPGVIKPGSSSHALVSAEDVGPTLLEAAGVPVPKEMTGVSFLKRLRGEPSAGRKYIFAERGPHGGATITPWTKANGVDYSRCVRSDRYKLIYNCTPWMEYAPVDSAGDPGWRQIVAAHQNGKLAPPFERAYFTHPRPIYELFDLEADPGELNNLIGKPEHAQLVRELKDALVEKMIGDFDYLPLPDQDDTATKANKKVRNAGKKNQAN